MKTSIVVFFAIDSKKQHQLFQFFNHDVRLVDSNLLIEKPPSSLFPIFQLSRVAIDLPVLSKSLSIVATFTTTRLSIRRDYLWNHTVEDGDDSVK